MYFFIYEFIFVFESIRCEGCIQLAPIWESLSKQFGTKGHALIAAVDCSNEKNFELCRENDITHMPSLRWGDPQNLQPYMGGPEFDELFRFARMNLRPFCSANSSRRYICSEEQNATIAEYEALDALVLDDKIEKLEDRIEEAQSHFTKEATILNDLANEFHDAKLDATISVDISLKLLKGEKGRRHVLATFDKYVKDDESGEYILKKKNEKENNSSDSKDEL